MEALRPHGASRFPTIADLPKELQPIVAFQEQRSYDGAITWWVCLFIAGCVIWDLLVSFPTDWKYVYFPEYWRIRQTVQERRCSAFTKKALAWAPTPAAFCHILARILTAPMFGLAFAYYRRPSSCQGELSAYLALLAVGTINAQIIFTLRTYAITRTLPYSNILSVFLWLLVMGTAAAWIGWVASVRVHTWPNGVTVPLNFRVGMHCGALMSGIWWPVVVYLFSFIGDAVMLLTTVIMMWTFYLKGNGQPLQEGTLTARVRRRVGQLSPIGGQFLFDAMRYFGIAVAVESVGLALSWHYLHRTHPANNALSGLALPLHALVSLAIAPRCVVNLRRAGVKRTDASGLTAVSSNPVNLYSLQNPGRTIPVDIEVQHVSVPQDVDLEKVGTRGHGRENSSMPNFACLSQAAEYPAAQSPRMCHDQQPFATYAPKHQL